MRHQEFEPPEALRDTVRCFWYDQRDFGEELTVFDVVPDGYAEIIFYFGTLYGKDTQLPTPFMVGLLNEPALFSARKRLEIIGVRCFPWTVFDLLGVTSGKEPVRVFDHPIARLQPVLAELVRAGDIAQAMAEVEQCFVRLRTQVAPDSILHKAGVAMRQANGTLPVRNVAEAAHATVRTLERRFKQSSGHTIKDVSALMRFEQVRNQLWIDPNASLAGLAHEFGYTDQSHLTRECKRFTGMTPAAFARKSRQRKQLLQRDFVAFVQA